MRNPIRRAGVLAGLVYCLLVIPIALSAESVFQPTLKIDAQKSWKKERADATLPYFGYVSANAGGFTLDGDAGHASFRWNHGLDADWHDHPMKFVGEAYDTDGNAYWVYSVEVNHDNHVDEVWMYFAQTVANGQVDEGYRIFFGHFDYPKGKRPASPEDHDIHLWCTDATRLKYHRP